MTDKTKQMEKKILGKVSLCRLATWATDRWEKERNQGKKQLYFDIVFNTYKDLTNG